MDDNIELAWAAGFLEGEGCFHTGTNKNNSACFYITACQTATCEPLDRLHKLFGGSITRCSKATERAAGRKSQDYFKWGVCGQSAITVASRLLPQLSQRRQEQITNALVKLVLVRCY